MTLQKYFDVFSLVVTPGHLIVVTRGNSWSLVLDAVGPQLGTSVCGAG